MEMPYVDVEQHGQHIKFDLELEKYAHTLDSFKSFIKRIIDSGTAVDKYGNKIDLPTHNDRVRFLSSLSNDNIVKMFLTKYHNTTMIDIVKGLK